MGGIWVVVEVVVVVVVVGRVFLVAVDGWCLFVSVLESCKLPPRALVSLLRQSWKALTS